MSSAQNNTSLNYAAPYITTPIIGGPSTIYRKKAKERGQDQQDSPLVITAIQITNQTDPITRYYLKRQNTPWKKHI